METKILTVKEWLKIIPDYDGFEDHVEGWIREGIPYGLKDLIRIARSYNLAPVRFQDGIPVFDIA